MSAAVRQEIAEAVSAVDGVTCHPYFVQRTEPGQAFVRLNRTEYPNPFGGVVHWDVVLVLPQDLAASERFLEQWSLPIREALAPHLVVSRIAPTQLALEGHGALLTAFFTGHREEE